MVEVKSPLWASIEGKDGLTFLESLPRPPEKKKVLFSHRMLSMPLRNYVIKKIKAPLQKVIILVGNRLPELTKENSVYPNTHNLLDIENTFLEYMNNSSKKEMFRCAWNLFIAVFEHDRFYRYPFEWFVEELIKKVLSGEWQPRLEGWPSREYESEAKWQWKEPEPYGGKHSIIYKIQAKRGKINKLLEEA